MPFVSIEPIDEETDFSFSRKAIDWIIIGGETGHKKEKILPQKEWIEGTIHNIRGGRHPTLHKG